MSARVLYLHAPFCKRKCSYCDFASFATPAGDPLMASYGVSLLHQIDEAEKIGLIDGLDTAYVGGGTPTFMGGTTVGLVERIAALGPSEVTVEANPDSASLDLLSNLRDAGATRISMGVQSLDDGELRMLGRVHDAQTALEALHVAVSLGLSVSADLMCAIPLQTPSSWLDTLEGVIGTGVGHVSVYPLMIEEGTPFFQAVEAGEMPAPDDGDEAARMEEAAAILTAHGYERYEVASYARPGRMCRHNLSYWTGASYLGIGAGAASMFGHDEIPLVAGAFPQIGQVPANAHRIRLSCETDRRLMAEKPSLADQVFDVEFLNERESLAEDLMLGARLARGLDRDLVSRSREVMGQELDECLAGLIDDGYLDDALAPTAKGWLLGNELYGRLWDLAEAAD